MEPPPTCRKRLGRPPPMMAWRLGCLAAIVLTASASITYLEPVWEEQDPLPWMRPTLRKVPASTTRRHLTPLQTNQALKASQRMVEIAERRGKMQPQGIKALAAQDDVCTKRGCTAKATSRRKRAALSCKRSFFKGLAMYRDLLSPNAKVITSGDGDLYTAAKDYTQPRNEPYNFQTPVAIIYLGVEQDAAVVVQLAKATKCRICSRSGGHDSSGASICNGGIVVDTSQVAGIVLNQNDSYAVIQAGARFRNIYNTLAANNVLALGGLCPTVCLAGFSLGGGWGILSKSQGMGCDNVLSYTVATATSPGLVVADATGPHSDLFWALRGAGHTSYGIVTSMKYRTFPLPTVIAAYVRFPNLIANTTLDQAANALYFWQENYLNKPPLTLAVFPVLEKEGLDSPYFDLWFSAFLQTNLTGSAAVQEIVQLMQPLASLPNGYLADVSFYSFNRSTTPVNTTTDPQVWEYKRGQYVTRPLAVGEFRKLVEGTMNVPKGYSSGPLAPGQTNAMWSTAYFEPVEGAMAAPAPTDMAFSHRSVGFDLVLTTVFNPAHKGAAQAAVKYQTEAFEKWWQGIVGPTAYQNYPYLFYQAPAVALEAYYSPNLCRLVQIKAKYDPDEVFGSQQQGIPTSLKHCAPGA